MKMGSVMVLDLSISSTGWMASWLPLVSLTYYQNVLLQFIFIMTQTTHFLVWELIQLLGE